MFELFKKQRIPPRHRSAAYMNLAFGKLPTIEGSVGVCDQDPAPLSILTDEGDQEVGFTTILEHSTVAENLYIQIALEQEFEIYEIVIRHKTGAGYKKAATDQDVLLKTIDGANVTTTRDTQTVTGDDAFHDNELTYKGDGIPVQIVLIQTVMTSANKFTLDLSEIEVFGC